jgi:capsular polysaccharide biosynthesis protein
MINSLVFAFLRAARPRFINFSPKNLSQQTVIPSLFALLRAAPLRFIIFSPKNYQNSIVVVVAVSKGQRNFTQQGS